MKEAAVYVLCVPQKPRAIKTFFSRFFGITPSDVDISVTPPSEAARRMLDGLDKPYSPVRVVVSVDKLKEGWDTKRIAVMGTLCAMASEVLTQQTMGRGLRLPFGKRTGHPRIDQLDILAHTSFEELLNDENILHTFGLDGAVDGKVTGEDVLKHDVTTTPQVTGPDFASSPEVAPMADAGSPGQAIPDADMDGAILIQPDATVKAHELADEEAIEVEEPVAPVTVEINP